LRPLLRNTLLEHARLGARVRAGTRVLWLALVCAGVSNAAPPLETLPTDRSAADQKHEHEGRLPVGDPSSLSPVAPDNRAGSRVALERGLDWLAAQQAGQPDGSFPGEAPIAVTALGALAYMASGSSPGRGPHGRELERAIDYLLSRVDLEPDSERYGYISTGGDPFSKTHGHGFATLALAQAYSMSPRSERGARLQHALEAAVSRIEVSQGIEGGWHYEPVRVADHEGSVTICMVQALRAARNSGVRVDGKVITRAIDYVKRLQNDDGSFRYALGIDRASVALTAAAISTLNATGTYSGLELANAYDYVFRELAARVRKPKQRRKLISKTEYPYYERLYLVQAFWQHPDPTVYSEWAEIEERELIVDQELDEQGRGYWTHRRFGNCYATAVNCLVLALPERLLPIFQR